MLLVKKTETTKKHPADAKEVQELYSCVYIKATGETKSKTIEETMQQGGHCKSVNGISISLGFRSDQS
jgi:hypothetical protein